MQRASQIVFRKMAPRIAATNSANVMYSGRIATKTVRSRVLNQPRVFSTAAQDWGGGDSGHTLEPWDTHKIECHGDYREEAFLEDTSKPLYEHQQKLPKLPVPEVRGTLERLLPTVLPLTESKEEEESLKACVASFEGETKHLQERLLKRQEEFSKTGSSWLQHWWNTMGYLQVRCRSPINVSYYFHLQDDPTAFLGDGSVQVRRAASVLWHAAGYRYGVCSGTMPQETIGKKKTPLCSTAFKYMFHACRIPKKGQDSYAIYDPSRYTHAIVACKGHFFAVDFLDEHGQVIPVQILEERLQQCVDLANAQAPMLEMGWLTCSERDEWAENRNVLLEAGGVVMEDALEKIQSGALMLCLDDEEPISRRECAHMMLHGVNPTDGEKKPFNRFFDKSIQLIVAKNGKTGFLGEHTMMDGMPLVGFAAHVAKHSHEDAVRGSMTYSNNPPGGGVENIFQGALEAVGGDQKVKKIVDEAKEDYVNFTKSHAIEVQSFQAYGSDFMKKAGFSPDAYVQMAMQLATFRLWGKQAGTYEATQTRIFKHGRTETTRSVSPASKAFCEIMGLAPKHDDHVDSIRKKKIELLHDAVSQHVKFMGSAAKGEGVDRHLMGLSLCANEGESLPALYSHPAYNRAKTWRVSTSHLTHPLFVNWGYGQVVPDGLGLSYSVHPRSCMFSVTTVKETGFSPKVCQLIEEALLEMRTLIELDEPVRSKL